MRWLCWWRPPCVLRRVLVNVTYNPNEALQGVLWRYRGGWLVIIFSIVMTVATWVAAFSFV